MQYRCGFAGLSAFAAEEDHSMDRRGISKTLALLAAFPLLGFASGTTQAAGPGVSDQEVLIGALGPLTGATAFMGGPSRDGMELAISQINAAGGINGRKLKLTYEHAFTPAESVAAAKKLVEQDHVFVLILASGSTGAAAAADYVRATGVPTYNLFGSTSVIREPFANNVFHGQSPDVGVSGQKLVDRALSAAKGIKKIGVLAGTYAFPQANLSQVVPRLKAAGVEPVVEQFDQGARDYTSQLIAFARERVPAVIVLGSYSEAGFAVKQGPEKGLANVLWILDGSAINDAIIPIIGPENVAHVIGASNSPFYVKQPAAPIESFLAAWQAKFGKPPQGRPNVYDMIGYGDMYVLAEAIKATGQDLTWEKLIEAWSHLTDAKPSKLGGADVIFPESFTPNDHQGNKQMGAAVIKDGIWQVVPQ
jgi:branched-chain amino acid transport system substrate-binding protein